MILNQTIRKHTFILLPITSIPYSILYNVFCHLVNVVFYSVFGNTIKLSFILSLSLRLICMCVSVLVQTFFAAICSFCFIFLFVIFFNNFLLCISIPFGFFLRASFLFYGRLNLLLSSAILFYTPIYRFYYQCN